MTTDANIQCLQPEKMQGVHHAFDADGKGSLSYLNLAGEIAEKNGLQKAKS
jgi:hypothetical protein